MRDALLIVLGGVFIANALVIVITIYMQVVHGLPPPWGARPEPPAPPDYPGPRECAKDEP